VYIEDTTLKSFAMKSLKKFPLCQKNAFENVIGGEEAG